jgi:GTPase SAR1 family protein
VYDLTRPDTLDKIPLWQDQLSTYSPNAKLYLVGNKNDLEDERQISFSEGQKAQERYRVEHFFETSAKTGDHIQATFEHLAVSLISASRDTII